MEDVSLCPVGIDDDDDDDDEDDDGWRCRRHPAAHPSAGGVCPLCLRDRLLRLCSDCGASRPCGCGCGWSCPSTASSSSLSSLDLHRFAASAAAHVGAVGRVSHLIDAEPAFRRSRSAAFRLVRRPREAAAAAAGPVPAGGGGGWSRFWPFQGGKKAGDAEGNNAAALSRSRSVGAAVAGGGAGGGGGRSKGWSRYLPSPMRAFRRRKAAKVKGDASCLSTQ